MPPKTIFFNKYLFAGVTKYATLKNMPFTRAARILIKYGLAAVNDERDVDTLQKALDRYREMYLELKTKLEEL